jgi:hypothetical protein
VLLEVNKHCRLAPLVIGQELDSGHGFTLLNLYSSAIPQPVGYDIETRGAAYRLNGHSCLTRERMKYAALPTAKTAKAKIRDFLAAVPNT